MQPKIFIGDIGPSWADIGETNFVQSVVIQQSAHWVLLTNSQASRGRIDSRNFPSVVRITSLIHKYRARSSIHGQGDKFNPVLETNFAFLTESLD